MLLRLVYSLLYRLAILAADKRRYAGFCCNGDGCWTGSSRAKRAVCLSFGSCKWSTHLWHGLALTIKVMVSTSGAQLLPPDAVSILRETLLPMATILTPNIPEAKLLLGKKEEPNPQTYEQVVQLAADLQKLGSRYVLVKGGHFRTDVAARGQTKHRLIDVLHDGHQPLLIEKEFLKSRNTHGTGCSLACMEPVTAAHIIANKVSGHCIESGARPWGS